MGGGAAPRPRGSLDAPRVCAFGQLRLLYEDREVPIVGKPARVLGALLVKRGGVPLEELLENVWPVAPPKSARSALHVHLGTVRRLLGDAPPGATVERTGERYRLELEGWEVDLDLVEAITSWAHSISTSDPATASHAFDDVLAIWCGPALVLDGEPLSPSISSRFELARLGVEEARVEAMLETGELARAESSVIEMVEAHPYRECRWGQLMRIQAASGRTADALATFRRARHRLVEDLGVEPGPELQSIEASILAREQPVVERPDDLDPPPRPLGPLVGRERPLERIETTLGHGSPLVLLGAPGVGKTRLAQELATRAADSRRRVGWIDLRKAPFGEHDLAERVADWTRSWPGALLVLDNAETALAVVDEILAQISRTTPDAQVIVTSRVPLDSASLVLVLPALEVPSSDDPDEIEACESVRLLRTLLGMHAPNTSVTTDVAADLCRRVGGLPLGIRFAAELARMMPPAEVGRVAGSRLGSEIEAAVTAVLERLGDAERQALMNLSVVAGNVDARLAGALLGRDDADTMGRLIELGLVQFDPSRSDGPYSIIEPLRDLLAARLTEREREAALDRLADHCVERSQHGFLPPATNERGETLRVELTRELPWHRQAVTYLAHCGDDRRALSIASNLEMPLYALGWWATNTELQDATLAIPGPPSSARARVHSARGRPGLLHQMDVVHLITAIEMAEHVGDAATAAKSTYQLGIRRWWERCWDEALELLDRARRMATDCGDPFVEVEATRFGGVALVSAGKVERGLEVQIEVLRRVERARSNELHIPHVRMYLGHCRRHIGDDDAALVDLESARSGFGRIGNRASLIHVCAGLAELYTDRGRTGLALGRAGEALQIAASGKVTTYDPWVLCTIARVHAEEGDVPSALSAIDRAVGSLRRNWIGEIHRVAVDLAAATECLGELEATARLIGVAQANEDRRELPFRTPAERARLARATETAASRLGEAFDPLRRKGEISTVAEAVGPLIVDLG